MGGVLPLFAIPSYLFPAPSQIATTFVADAPALMRALWVTLRVTLIALALAVVIGAAIAFLFVQSPIIERSLFPVRHHHAGDADRRDRAADHHPGQEHPAGADHLRHHHRDLPGDLEHHRRAAQRRPGPPGPVHHQPRVAPAKADVSAHPERAAVLLCRPCGSRAGWR